MTVNQGKVHKYLGMTLDYTTKVICKVIMLDYIEELFKTFNKMDQKATGTKTSAAPSNLFVVKEDCTKLTKEESEKFHSVMAKILFATKRARPDTGTLVSFLTTRVIETDEDNWFKLKHLIKYVRGKKEIPLILGANGTRMLKWYVDGSYGFHPNMWGNSGGGLTMGRGFPVTASKKHKLNTRRSTK